MDIGIRNSLREGLFFTRLDEEMDDEGEFLVIFKDINLYFITLKDDFSMGCTKAGLYGHSPGEASLLFYTLYNHNNSISKNNDSV